MRGKVGAVVCGVVYSGITPAYAGKSQASAQGLTPAQDHPPRMRGKVVYYSWHQKSTRITPAYAGKRAPERWNMAATWDHPRVCGEKA